MATANDQTLLNGMPKLHHQVHLLAQPFYNVRHDLSCLHDLVLKGERIIVSSSMRKEINDLLQTGHVGIERCKCCAHESIYWPGLKGELKDLVSNCATRLQHRNTQPKGRFPVMAETTCNHISSKEISQVIITAMVLATNFCSKNCLRVISAMRGNPP